MSKLTNKELIFITLGVIGLSYFFHRKNTQNLSVDGVNENSQIEDDSMQIEPEIPQNNIVVKIQSFLPQDYPLIQLGIMEAILEDINRIIQEQGVKDAIDYCKKMYFLFKKNQPTEVQEMKMNFYRDIAENIKKQENG